MLPGGFVSAKLEYIQKGAVPIKGSTFIIAIALAIPTISKAAGSTAQTSQFDNAKSRTSAKGAASAVANLRKYRS